MSHTIEIALEDPHVRWHRCGGEGDRQARVHARGYARVEDQFVEGRALADTVLAACGDGDPTNWRDQLKRLIPSLSGCWALAVQWPDGPVLAAVDRWRSIPLFYTITPESFVLAASALDAQRHRADLKIDELAALEYLLAGWVTDGATVYEGVHQVRPGEIIEFDPDHLPSQVHRERYYRYYPEQRRHVPSEQLEEELEAVYNAFIPPMVQKAGGKVVIPLSGGLDSRMVAATLRKHDVRDVLCFSYGDSRDNDDAGISRQIAEALGYEWAFVEYNGEKWAEVISSREMEEYWAYASKGVSLPHFQDFPAVREIAAERDLGDAVFFPGIPGYPPETPLPSNYEEIGTSPNGPTVEEHILGSYYWLWPMESLPKQSGLRPALLDKIKATSAAPIPGVNCHPATRVEMWASENRETMFMTNSVRGYEFFSARWRTLWDCAYMDFLTTVPIAQRLGRRLFINTVRNRIYTGPAAKLAQIPIVSARWGLLDWGEDLPERYTKRPSQKGPVVRKMRQIAKGMLSRIGLLNPVLNLLHPKTVVEGCCRMETWFTGGRDPKLVTVGDVLRRYGTMEKLPKALLPLVEPWLKRRVDLIYFNGLLSVIVLGELCAGTYLER